MKGSPKRGKGIEEQCQQQPGFELKPAQLS